MSSVNSLVSVKCPPVLRKKEEEICVKVPQVICRGVGEVLIESRIPLPDLLVVEEINFQEVNFVGIKEIDKQVVITNCTPSTDRVLVNGFLIKNVNFKTEETLCPFDSGAIATGDVEHTTVFLPFSLCIVCEGSMPTDRCQVEFAGVIAEKDEVLPEPGKDKDKDKDHKKERFLLEKACVVVDVKVLRDVQITVSPEEPNICPPSPLTTPVNARVKMKDLRRH